MEENAVFEIDDFTIVTDMEHFGATFEGIIQKFIRFDRTNYQINSMNYDVAVKDSETISIGPNKLIVELWQPTVRLSNEHPCEESPAKLSEDEIKCTPFSVVEEIGNITHGFECDNELTLKFGIRECIVIYPNDSSCTLTDESQANTIMGMIKAVMNSTRCEIPVLCYMKEKQLNMIEGYASDGNASVKFSSVVLRNINKRHCSLSNLLNLFKEHLGVTTSAFHDEVRISSRLTHFLPVDTVEFVRIHTQDSFRNLASGPVSNLPISGFEISAVWRSFLENSLTENHDHSDFDMNHATYWNVRAKPVKHSLSGVLDEILGVYTDDRRKAIRTDLCCKTILGKSYIKKELPNAFQKLTVSTASEVNFGRKELHEEEGTSGPISQSMIRAWVDLIFDENWANEMLSHELNLINVENMSKKELSPLMMENNKKLGQMFNGIHSNSSHSFLAPYKSAKKGTTTWNLITAVTNSRIFMENEPRAEPQLWIEFLLRLREKYDQLETIEKINGGIDHMQCAFSQKMQMLQLCIDARKKRHLHFDNAHSNATDEFFDAHETFNKHENTDEMKQFGEGRLQETSMMLIGNPSLPMFIPITQDACPLTDEMIDARNEHLFSLSDKERIDVQMELVQSDMQSFKAANPGCVFADFLRWHSPKDYDETTNSISERMLIPNNVWVESWQSAPAVAVVNQARIFNDTKIAEEILETFENATLDQVRNWMKPTVFALTFERLREMESNLDVSEEKLEQRKKAARTLAAATLNNSISDYNKIIKYCSQMEMIYNMKIQLFHLFEKSKETMHTPYPSEIEIKNCIKQLVNTAVWSIWKTPNEEEPVFTVKPQEPIGRAIAIISKVDQLSQQQLINGNRKEYIFAWNLKRPSTTTLPTAHRMYCDLRSDRHSLHFAISNDASFFNTSYL